MAKVSPVGVSSRVSEFCDTGSGVPNITFVASVEKSIHSSFMILSFTRVARGSGPLHSE